MAARTSENVLLLSTLSILQIIKEAQQQHGLRHGDYQRYRGYCSRKIRRVRKSLHATNVHKARNFQQKRFTAEQVASDLRYLLVCLFEAERCWAFSMQMKEEANSEPRKRFHLINKLRRAVIHSQELENFCKAQESNVDAATKLEAQAYNAWLHACLALELQDWQRANDYFSASRSIYDQLSKASSLISNDQTSASSLDLYQQRCQEVLTPQLRYCAYRIGDESAAADLLEMRRHMAGDQENVALADIDKLIAQTREKQAEQLKSEIVWCNHKINLAKAPNKVKSFCANLKQFDAQLNEADKLDTKISLYEQLLIDCRDAMQAIRDENKGESFKIRRDNEEEEGSSTVTANGLSEVQILYFWLTSIRLNKTVDKYLALIKGQQNQQLPSDKISDHHNFDGCDDKNLGGFFKPTKPLDLVRLYDGVLQNLNEITFLPDIQNDLPVFKDVQCQIAYYTSFRCYFVAEVFASQKKWREALALYARCVDYCANAKKLILSHGAASNLDVVILDELAKIMNSRKYTAHANCVVGSQQATLDSANQLPSKAANDKIYIEDFTTYRRLNPQDVIGPKRTVHVTRMPPDFKPMACKPLFFDLALNHLRFPSLESKMDVDSSATGNKKPSNDTSRQPPGTATVNDQSKPGLGGLMKGWFWGGSGGKK